MIIITLYYSKGIIESQQLHSTQQIVTTLSIILYSDDESHMMDGIDR